MVIVGRKGQICNLDSFSVSSNDNVCVIGMSGSGKSMFLQDFVMSHLARGTRIFVVDIGRSFEKSCRVMRGDFVEFGSNSTISLNPFVNIASGTNSSADSASGMLSMLKMLIAKMAAPKSGTKDIEDATIAESLNKVWEKYESGITNKSICFMIL